jgi:hypothetical protein
VSSFSADQVVATGPATSYLEFLIHFFTDPGEPFTFSFVALGDHPNTKNIVDAATLTWNGTDWDVVCQSPIPGNDIARIPIPGAVVLLGAGLFRPAAYGRRRRSEV